MKKPVLAAGTVCYRRVSTGDENRIMVLLVHRTKQRDVSFPVSYTHLDVYKRQVREGGSTDTELYVLGVDPKFAGIGLGAALLGETLRQMQLHEPNRITLYVDGDNTNAVDLYLRAGFEVEQRSVQYLRRASI